MRIQKVGRICDRLWLLGKEDTSIYLLEGDAAAILINGGLAYAGPEVLRQIEAFGIDESRITKMLILHSHFDHTGLVPLFKRRHPEMTLYGSSRALEVLKKPKVLDAINAQNHWVTEQRGVGAACRPFDLDWRPGIEGIAVGQGDRIDLGGLQLEIYETPGHSPCSISAYLPDLKILFPSEAAGLPLGDKIITYGTSDYTAFEKSLRKLKPLPVAFLCSDHYGYVCGQEAAGFVDASIEEAARRRALIIEAYKQEGDTEAVARRMARLFADEGRYQLVPRDVFDESHRQMVLHIIAMHAASSPDNNASS